MTPQHHLPADIERTSLSIITAELETLGLTPPPETAAVVKRVIHTTADFDYARNLRFTQGAVAAGDQPDDRVERHPVGRRQLRGVGHGQTARRARTDVEHSSAALHPLDDPLDESFHRGNGRGHGIGHTAVFAVDARQQVVHRHPLQIVVGRSLFRYSDLFHM